MSLTIHVFSSICEHEGDTLGCDISRRAGSTKFPLYDTWELYEQNSLVKTRIAVCLQYAKSMKEPKHKTGNVSITVQEYCTDRSHSQKEHHFLLRPPPFGTHAYRLGEIKLPLLVEGVICACPAFLCVFLFFFQLLSSSAFLFIQI